MMQKSDKGDVVLVDLTQFRLESHVRQCFEAASVLAEGQPVNARHALLALMIKSRTAKSEALSKLTSLLSAEDLPELHGARGVGEDGHTTVAHGPARRHAIGVHLLEAGVLHLQPGTEHDVVRPD